MIRVRIVVYRKSIFVYVYTLESIKDKIKLRMVLKRRGEMTYVT